MEDFVKIFKSKDDIYHITLSEDNRLLSAGTIDALNGINEKYYFHVIYRQEHSVMASIIGDDLKEGFGK